MNRPVCYQSKKVSGSGGVIMLLWHRDIQPAAAASEEKLPEAASGSAYEAKRQRALQILGERWLLHRANAPDRRPTRSVLMRSRAGDAAPAG
jgi:hypothetical protein